MKNAILFCVLFCTYSILYAQNKGKEDIAEEKYQNFQSQYYMGDFDSANLIANDLLNYSIENQLKTYEAIAYSRIAEVKLIEQKQDSALEYFRKALVLFIKTQDRVWCGKMCSRIGNVHFSKENFDSTTIYYTKATELIDLSKDTTWYGYANYQLGYFYFQQGIYILANQHIQKALYSFTIAENWQNAGIAYNTLALIYRHTKNKDKEEAAYFKAIEAFNKIDTCMGLGMAYNNLAESYFNKGDTAKAFSTLEKAKKIYIQVNSIAGQVGYYSTLSFFYINSDPPNYEKTIQYRTKSIELAEEIGDTRQYADGTSFLGRAYLETKQLSQAKNILEKGLEVAQEYNLSKEIIAITEILATVYNDLGMPQNAYDCLHLQSSLKDSIYSSEKVIEFANLYASIAYEQERLNDSIQSLNNIQQIELKHKDAVQKKQRSIIILGFSAIILLIFGIMLFLISKKRRKNAELMNEKNTIINKSLKEKELLLKEIHHRVKNNFQIISSLIELQSKDIKDEKAIATINEGQNRVKAMALIHQKLYQNEDITTIDFSEYCMQLIKEINSTFGTKTNIAIELNIPEIFFDIDTAIPLGLIISEIVTNSFKYAFISPQKHSLQISLKQTKSINILEIKDSGPGLPTGVNFTNSKTFGLKIVSRLAQQLLGSAKYNYENGSVFTIEFLDTKQRKDFD